MPNSLLFIFSLLVFFLIGTKISKADGVDGACGGANGQVLPSTPTTNLCDAGTASVVTGNGPWTWTCAGSDATCTTGDSKDCTTTDSCAGKQLCAAGAWGACTKNVPTCGSNDYCSKGQSCNSAGVCVNKCSVCGCPEAGKTHCNADESCSSGAISECDPTTQIKLVDDTCASQCSDGTAVNRCSATSFGLQCLGVPAGAPTHVELVAACNSGCACPGYKSCQGDNTCAVTDLPESFSWANKDGKNYITFGANQGGSYNCWAYAAVAAVEAGYNIGHGPGTAPDLSETSVVTCLGADYSTTGWPYVALDYIRTKGVVEEGCSQLVGGELKCVDTCTPKHSFGTLANPTDLFRSLRDNGPFPIIINNGTHAVLMVGWVSGGNILYRDNYGQSSLSQENPANDQVQFGGGTPQGVN